MRIFRLRGILIVVSFAFALNATAQESGLSVDGTQQWKIIYYPKLPDINYEMEGLRTNIASLISKCYQVYDIKNNIQKKPSDVVVFEDRIEIAFSKRQNMMVNLSDILDLRIDLKKNEAIDHRLFLNPYSINIGNVVYFTYDANRLEDAKKLTDFLFYLQYQINEKRYSAGLDLFVPIAARYRELKDKPTVSEEQRKYIVQAETCTQQKEYAKAIALYKKAIAIDQTAYPAAYSNIALLYAQINIVDRAIYCMKKYLLLEPEAADARSAQDKIYGWELRFQK